MAACQQNRVAGVEYYEMALLPGRPMFRCDRLSASLQVSRCSEMWRDANAHGAALDRLVRCRGCQVGAGHAGENDPTYHRLRGLGVCARCQRTDLRLIGGNVCVGCKNREYEWVKGRNAKGKFPAHHPALARRSVRVCIGGRVSVVSRDLTVSTTELVVELLRDSPTRVLFGAMIGKNYGQT